MQKLNTYTASAFAPDGSVIKTREYQAPSFEDACSDEYLPTWMLDDDCQVQVDGPDGTDCWYIDEVAARETSRKAKARRDRLAEYHAARRRAIQERV